MVSPSGDNGDSWRIGGVPSSGGGSLPAAEVVFGPAADGEDSLLGELAAVALEAAAGAGAIAAGALGGDVRVETKSSITDMVSEVDRRCEDHIAGVIDRCRPDDGLLGEESAERAGSSGVRWVVDPLDGTTNYLFGVPAWAVSVAAEIGGRPVVGVVLDPSRGELWAAVTGRGARCNGRPVRAAEGRSELATALVATGFGYDRERRAWQAEVLRSVLPEVRDVRRFGAASLDLCWVAGGRVDAYYEWGLQPWDLAAGALICAEAGAVVSSEDGLCRASTASLAAPLARLLASAVADLPRR